MKKTNHRRHVALHSGAKQRRLITKACGTTLLVSNETLMENVSHTQYTPPAQLEGRAAGVRLCTRAYNVTICATSLPPEKGCTDNETISKYDAGGRKV
eukprot:5220464-Pyramimonas_sp.AAC.1